MKTIFLKVGLFALLTGTIFSCKKNEENFDLKTDLLTPIISFSAAGVTDEDALWRVDRLRVSKTSKNRSTNFLTVLIDSDTEIPADMREFYIGFAEKNCIFTDVFTPGASSTAKTKGLWQILNNDEILLKDTSEVVNLGSTSYFEVELSNVEYTDSNHFTSLMGVIPYKLGKKWTRIFKHSPTGKIEYLKLVVDKTYLSEDKSDEIHNYTEIYLSRIIPTFSTLTTREEYK